MPRTYKLTWQPGSTGRPGRWRKKYRGRSHYFDGGRGKTDREAYDAAVAAWEKLKVKLDDAAPKPHQEEYEREIYRWEAALSWSNKHGDSRMSVTAEERLAELRRRLDAPKPTPIRPEDTFDGQFDRSIRAPMLDKAIRELAADTFPEEPRATTGMRTVVVPLVGAIDRDPLGNERLVWQDRLEVMDRSQGSVDSALETYIKKFLDYRRRDVESGVLSAGRLAKLTSQLSHFQDWVGGKSDVSEITGERLLDYRGALLTRVQEGKWSSTTASERMVAVKSLVRWLWEMEAIPTLPRVLDGKAKKLDIGKSRQPIKTFEVDEIATLLKAASDRTKLYLLLMLNTGMTQKDISDLEFGEVDWKTQRIIRKRSKTKRFDNVPVVEHLLWDETFQLLVRQRNPSGKGRVLVNENGEPICRDDLGKEGKYKKNDNVKNAYDRLKEKTGISKPLKSLKKTSATMIRNNKEYQGLEDLFLGHAPRKMSDRHYAKPPQDLLNEATAWLRLKYDIPKVMKAKKQKPAASTKK